MKNFGKIKAIILDKDGVFVDFHKLWLRIIAYRAQLIAENSSDTSDVLVKIRTDCIRAMGVDEKDEAIDPYGPCSMPVDQVRLALATALFINKNAIDSSYTWSKAFNCVDEAIARSWESLTIVDLSEEIKGSIKKIQELYKSKLKLAVFTSDSEANTRATLKKFGLSKEISAITAGQYKTTKLFTALCKKLDVKPENTIMISDAPHDLEIAKAAGAKTIGVLSGIMSRKDAANADQIINSLTKFNLTKKKIAR